MVCVCGFKHAAARMPANTKDYMGAVVMHEAQRDPFCNIC